ncbi:hypothetical protein [Actinoplanes cyaneus]|nr:hypothetical protein [Actinoplanes cyaneus]MCW2135952.1 hypothetical protein [Actinoplanes cyaneus]
MGFEDRSTAPVMNRRAIITLDFPGTVPAVCRLEPVDAAPESRFVVRRDLAPAQAGVPMMLRVRVLDAVDRPLPGAVLEISHRAPGASDPALHGAQVTDPHGYAEFKTVFPGWEPDVPAGIDVTLHLAGSRDTGRLHFPAQVTSQVAGLPAYRGNPAPPSPTSAGVPHVLPPPAAGIPHVVPPTPAGIAHVVPRDRYDLTAGLLVTISAVTEH